MLKILEAYSGAQLTSGTYSWNLWNKYFGEDSNPRPRFWVAPLFTTQNLLELTFVQYVCVSKGLLTYSIANNTITTGDGYQPILANTEWIFKFNFNLFERKSFLNISSLTFHFFVSLNKIHLSFQTEKYLKAKKRERPFETKLQKIHKNKPLF